MRAALRCGGVRARSRRGPSRSAPARRALPCSAARDASASVVEAAATAVLVSRLRRHSGVSCSVDCTLPGLLSGRVESARISGSSWQSPKQLTCRSLDFRVGAAALDGGALLTRGVIALSTPARGSGSVCFNAADFGHFLTHPLMSAAAARAVSGRRFAFAAAVSFGAAGVRFEGVFEGERYACVLRPPAPSSPARAVSVEAAGGPAAAEVAAGLTRFFSELCIDLEGTALRYADMALSADAAALTLRLSLVCTRFPRSDFAF